MANWKESMIFALNMGKLIHKNNKNKWHMIKADPRFGACRMISSSANMQHQQPGLNPPNNPKVDVPFRDFTQDDLKDQKDRFSIISHKRLVTEKLWDTSCDLENIAHELSMSKDISPQDMLTKLDTIIVMVRMMISSSNIVEDDDSVVELKDKLNDDAFISRELMLIDKLSEASNAFFKIYHKLLIIRKDILTKPVQDTLAELDAISKMIWKTTHKIGFKFICDKGDDCICAEDDDI